MADLPEEAIVEERFLAASGPGGQNVKNVFQSPLFCMTTIERLAVVGSLTKLS